MRLRLVRIAGPCSQRQYHYYRKAVRYPIWQRRCGGAGRPGAEEGNTIFNYDGYIPEELADHYHVPLADAAALKNLDETDRSGDGLKPPADL